MIQKVEKSVIKSMEIKDHGNVGINNNWNNPCGQ
jgi:hypothetical protein